MQRNIEQLRHTVASWASKRPATDSNKAQALLSHAKNMLWDMTTRIEYLSIAGQAPHGLQFFKDGKRFNVTLNGYEEYKLLVSEVF